MDTQMPETGKTEVSSAPKPPRPPSIGGRLNRRGFRIAAAVLLLAAIGMLLSRSAWASERLFRIACAMSGGKTEVSSNGWGGRWFDCISELKKTADGGKECSRDDDCEGACVGHFGDTQPEYFFDGTGFSPASACSDGASLYAWPPSP